MEVIQVTDYDVLADEMPDEKFELTDYRKHIGNSRFGVLLDMYREAFEISYSQQKDEDCQKIVERIVDVTCHKDVSIIVTKGRFLVKPNGEGDWETLDEEKARKLVHQVLANPPEDEDEEEENEVDTVPSSLSSMSINDKKRGRRRSLLRRSASESTMLEDKKKTYRVLGVEEDGEESVNSRTNNMSTIPMPNLRRGQSANVSSGIPTTMTSIRPTPLSRQMSTPIPSSNGMIAAPKGMDVVLAEGCRNLSSREGIVGNNRLQVMLTLQGARYGTLPPAEQDKVAMDLVRAVCQYWGGRLLVEQGLSFRKLSDEESHNSIKALLSAESEGELSVVGSGSVTPPPPVSSGGSSSPKPLLSAPQPPDFLRNASMELLSVGGMGRPPNMQSQAVKSLQQRKAKRAIAKNLGQGRSIPDHFPDFNEMGPSS